MQFLWPWQGPFGGCSAGWDETFVETLKNMLLTRNTSTASYETENQSSIIAASAFHH
jgi:hypothetical protein